jgi:predicted  nucleic acid-binding Zn-ribbon protein
MRETEKSLQMEIDRGNKDRVALEEQIQEARQRSVGDQILIRLRENEIETLSRELKTIKGAFEGIQLNMVSVMRENDQLKSALNDHERNNIQMKSLFENREQQIG